MKTRTWILIIIIVVALILIKLLFLRNDKAKPVVTGKPKTQVVNVTGYIAGTKLLENKIYSSGTVMANEEVVLHPEVSGKLVSILFKEGSTVGKGALLAKISDADLQAQLKKLRYQVQLSSERSKRLKGLLEIEGVSKEEYEASYSQIQTLEADMDYVRAQIAKTEIRAPFSGKIGLKQVSAGSYVTPASVIATMQQTNVLKIEFTVPEKYSGLIQLNERIHFKVDNMEDNLVALVYAREPKIDAETRNVNVRAIYNNSNARIIPGAFARVEIDAGKDAVSIMIPTEAVIPELKGKKVFVNRSGKAVPVSIETGIRTDTEIEVLSGLIEGDTVVVTGIMSLKPGADIKILDLKKTIDD